MIAHSVVEPTVIDEDLLAKAVSEQCMGDAAEIARKEGIDFAEVQALRLDYKNILRIEHLWQLSNLVKLQLDNNIVEKIEGLGHLVNLRWLDLSFNNISVIEGLDALVQLTDLSLFNNRIAKLENLDSLKRLTVLSIGNNDIQDMQQLAYLSRFPRLRLLNVSGNPLCKNSEYRAFILSRIKSLKYLDYRLVESQAIKDARAKYIDDIIAIEEEHKIVAKQQAEAVRVHELDEIHARAFLPGIHNLFTLMLDHDPDYARILLLARETLLEVQTGYRAKFDAVVADLTALVLARHDRRAREVKAYADCVSEAMAIADTQGRARLDTFLHAKKIILRDIAAGNAVASITAAAAAIRMPHRIASAGAEANGGAGAMAVAAANSHSSAGLPADELKIALTALSDDLMAQELALVEGFEDLGKEFERNYTDLCAEVKEQVAGAFTRFRELENEHHEKVTENILASVDRQTKAGDLEELDDALRDLLRDKDAIVNHLTGSHDYHLSKIDSLEETFNSGLARSLDTVVSQVHEFEVQRNRARLREIALFSERTLHEIDLAEENGA
ncbi:hypothetical protein BC828DRAFT_382162 [Blastocladiella britannica]|nr:hypothetical protein BC828DRAFT_382162 [Blastocladiella britannica]